MGDLFSPPAVGVVSWIRVSLLNDYALQSGMDFSSGATAVQSLLKRTEAEPSASKVHEAAVQLEVLFAAGGDNRAEMASCLEELLGSERWDALSTALCISKELCESDQLTPGFKSQLYTAIDSKLQHTEPRVRSLAIELLGLLAQKDGVQAYLGMRERLLCTVKAHLRPLAPEEVSKIDSKGSVLQSEVRALETSLAALKALVSPQGCGRAAVAQGLIDDDFLKLAVEAAATHQSRHVRDAAFSVAQAVIDSTAEGSLSEEHRARLASTLAGGLQDSSCDVRYAASLATRSLISHLPAQARESCYPLLLPRMCLNRYYLAEGVRSNAQQLWKEVVGEDGRSLVGAYGSYFCTYYLEAAATEDQAVREAAAHSIAELATKIDKDAITPYLPQLLSALLVCLEDSSWAVRDAACVATGRFTLAYPAEVRPYLDRLWDRWFAFLADINWSVRDDAATTLAAVIKAYGSEALSKVEGEVRRLLPMVKQQADRPVKEHHHQDRTYSMPITPRLAPGGPSEAEPFSRPPEPWEHTDGAVYMIRELSQQDVAPSLAASFLPDLADTLRYRSFPQAPTLRENIFRNLVVIARRLGKQEFKKHMEPFLEPLFESAADVGEGHGVRMSARACLRAFDELLGRDIFVGRLPQHLRDTFLSDTSLSG